jgi:hypothetical protein
MNKADRGAFCALSSFVGVFVLSAMVVALFYLYILFLLIPYRFNACLRLWQVFLVGRRKTL